ncbi:MAG: hypothetical protein R3Y56_07695 [Akkermansia sp.]
MPTAAQYTIAKTTLPSELDTKQYSQLGAQVLERSFVMACVTDAKILDKNKQMVTQILQGKLSPAEAREQLRRHYQEIGYQARAGEEGSIKDLSTVKRMKATIDTNVAMARGWMRKKQLAGNAAKPGLELFRAGHAKKPRDWATEWSRAFAEVGGVGAAPNGEWIALHDSPIWVALSVFNTAYPPFDWGSHMDIRPVGLRKCIALGLIPDPQSDDPETAKRGKEQLQQMDAQGVESLNHDTRIEAPISDKTLREDLATRLKGIAEYDGRTVRLCDPNGTRPYSWDEIGDVITAPNAANVPQLQADAAREFFRDSRAFAPEGAKGNVQKVSKTTKAAFIDLVERIESINDTQCGTIMRGLDIPENEQAAFLESIKANGYGARPGYIAESWSSGTSTAHRYAGSKGIVLVCPKYQNRKRVDGLYQKLDLKMKNPRHPESTEGESLFPASSQFDYVSHYQRDGITYIEVHEHEILQPVGHSAHPNP